MRGSSYRAAKQGVPNVTGPGRAVRLRASLYRSVVQWRPIAHCRSLRAPRVARDQRSTPAIGRDSITEAAQGFMVGFPDLRVEMDELRLDGASPEYHWTLTGTNAGPDGTGRSVVRGPGLALQHHQCEIARPDSAAELRQRSSSGNIPKLAHATDMPQRVSSVPVRRVWISRVNASIFSVSSLSCCP